MDNLDQNDYKVIIEKAQMNPAVLSGSNEKKQSVLFQACLIYTHCGAIPPKIGTKEDLDFIKRIIELGADPNMPDEMGMAPLHISAMTQNKILAETLLSAGANRTGLLMKANGGSPLALALFYGNNNMGSILLNPSETINLKTAAALNFDLSRFLLDSDLSPLAHYQNDFYRPSFQFPEWIRNNCKQELLDEALTWAARNNSCSALETILDWGANINGNPYRGTALLWACYKDSADAVKLLIDNGADIDLKHDFGGTNHGKGATALHLAAQYSCLVTLKLLLERGADPTIKDDAYKATPLDWAKHSGASESVTILEKFGE